MVQVKKSFWTGLKEYVLITIGLFLYVLGWVLFLLPNNLVGGGVSGVSSIVQYATNGAVKLGYTYFCLNVVLLVVALFVLGKSFGWKTVYAIFVASALMNIGQEVMPASIVKILALDNGKLMSTIMGAILSGVGIGMTMSQGGSTGGTDIIALMVNKYRNVSPGRMILAMDVVIILSSAFVPSYQSDGTLVPWADKITTVVFGFILVAINSLVLDMYLSGSRQSVQLFVLSPKYEEIADAITDDLHRGVTVLDGKGWYTKHDMQVLMIITRKADLSVFLKYINAIDSNAFISVCSVTGVYGKGFDTFKGKEKRKHKNLS